MNGRHLRAFLWLRWRLRLNQLKRGGTVNAVILATFAVGAAVLAVVLFVASIPIGAFVLHDVPPVVLLYVWDGLVAVFLFCWIAGLLTELQRFESLSLGKFLHLPVSLSSVFLINYLSSLPSVSLLLFLPAALGLNLGLLFGRGAVMFLLLPMLASFLLMVTAITYQFQGWLAALMANPRRRRTVIVVATMLFILISQAPQLVNVLYWQNVQQNVNVQQSDDLDLITRETNENVEEAQEYGRAVSMSKSEKEREEIRKKHEQRLEEIKLRFEEIRRERETRKQDLEEKRSLQIEETARLLNVLLPPGWLPLGVEAVAEGRTWPILLAILGPTLIGTASLWRAYRTTLRLCTGQYNSGGNHATASPMTIAASSSNRLLERKLPWLSEQATVIALGGFRSLLRAPEAKMLLLTPLILPVIFGSMFLVRRVDVPEAVRPLLPFGAMMMILFSLPQLIGNQFGFDRNGFRVFVLCPARRHDILLGKNLAVAPLALTLGAVAAVFAQVVYPMRPDHFLALAPRFLSMYLLYCLPANAISIFAPMRIAAGSFKAAQPGGIAILLQMLFTFLCPVILAPTLLPLGIEWAAEELGWRRGLPIDLGFSLLECVGIVYIYSLILRWQGDWLQAREQRILQIVTTRVGAE